MTTFNGAHNTVPTLNLQTYPPALDLRAELKKKIKAMQEEQSELQRGILRDAESISEAEQDRRRAMSAVMDDKIDYLLAEYRAVSAAQGILPTPRPQPLRAPLRAPPQPPALRKTAITRPPGAVKGGGVPNVTSPHKLLVKPPLVKPPMASYPPKVHVDAEKTAVHVNPLANCRGLSSMQAMSTEIIVNI